MLYTAKEIKRILGITPGQLFHWGRTWGLIEPEVKAKGRQGKNKYSLENLFQLAVIKELVNFGIELSFIEEIVRSEQFCDSYKEESLIITRSENEKNTKIFLVINTREIRQEIEEKTGERFWRKGG